MTRWTLLAVGLMLSGAALADPSLGRMGGQPFQLSDLSLREQLQLYEEAGRLELLWRQAGERYAFDRLLEERAKAAGISKEDYLKSQLPPSTTSVTDEQVDRYLDQNPQVARRFQGKPEVLRLRVQQALIEQEREQRLSVLRQAWFTDPGVQFESLFGGIAPPRLLVPKDVRDQSLGPATAPLDVVVFLDLECPYCRRTFPLLIELQERFPEKVRLVFKHLPLPIHPQAITWAVAAECAGKAGRFLDFAREVYSKTTLGRTPLEVAEKLALDVAAFDACLTGDEAVKNKVSADVALAAELGIAATPTLVIGDVPVVGQKSRAELEAIVNGKLAAPAAAEAVPKP
jgi:protein-disulfide isomerase